MSRVLQIESGISDIMINPILGRFGGQIDEFGFIGFYMHNILSYWRQFGLLVFFIFCILLFLFPLRINRVITFSTKGEKDLFQFLFLFTALNMLTSKAFEWYFVWLFVGLAACVYSKRRQHVNLVSEIYVLFSAADGLRKLIW